MGPSKARSRVLITAYVVNIYLLYALRVSK